MESFDNAFSRVDVRINFFHPNVNVLSSSSDFGIILASSTASSSVKSHSLTKSLINFLATSGFDFREFCYIVKRPALNLVHFFGIPLFEDFFNLR